MYIPSSSIKRYFEIYYHHHDTIIISPLPLISSHTHTPFLSSWFIVVWNKNFHLWWYLVWLCTIFICKSTRRSNHYDKIQRSSCTCWLLPVTKLAVFVVLSENSTPPMRLVGLIHHFCWTLTKVTCNPWIHLHAMQLIYWLLDHMMYGSFEQPSHLAFGERWFIKPPPTLNTAIRTSTWTKNLNT